MRISNCNFITLFSLIQTESNLKVQKQIVNSIAHYLNMGTGMGTEHVPIPVVPVNKRVPRVQKEGNKIFLIYNSKTI